MKLQRGLVWMVMQVLLASTVMWPAEPAMAWSKPAPVNDTLADPSPLAWHNWAAVTDNWTSVRPVGGGVAVPVPKDNFQLFGQGSFSPGATGGFQVSTEMFSGDKWITLAQESVGTAGISSRQISNAMQHFPRNAAYVFAQYSPENATGRVTVQKVEKTPDGKIRVWQADFTPWSGQLWAAQGKYRSASEISAGSSGYNPFVNFAGATTDPVFHNLNWEAMKVVVGHAMRRYAAVFGFVAVDQPSVTQTSSSSSSLFSTTVTTTVTGYVSPKWYVATPMEATPSGESGQICVTGGNAGSTIACDDPAHIAIAGVMFSVWQGGNMPAGQDLIYQQTNRQSGWNVLFFTVLFGVITWGLASVLAPEMVAGLGGDLTFAGGAAGSYGMASTVFGSGGSLMQTQQGFFGATGNGWQSRMIPTSSVQANMMAIIQANHVAVPMGSGGLSATNALYSGACGVGFSVSQCQRAGLDPGTIWRPDSYAEYNSTKALRQRYTTCTTAISQGGLGLVIGSVAAEQCAAPVAGVIQ